MQSCHEPTARPGQVTHGKSNNMVNSMSANVPAPEMPRTVLGMTGTRRRGAILGLAVWVVIVAAGILWPQLAALDRGPGISAAPFCGHWMARVSVATVVAAAIGVGVAVVAPRLFGRLGDRWVPV